MISYPLFYPTFVANPITVSFVAGTATDVVVTWPAVTGSTGYNIYGSASPYTRNKLNTTLIPAGTHTYTYTLPHVNRDVYWHFWIGSLDGTIPTPVETLITLDAATLYSKVIPFYDVQDPQYTPSVTGATPQSTDYGKNMISEPAMNFYSEEIRRRNLVMLENDGEVFEVYLRRWGETPCPKEDERRSPDPDYNSLTKCPLCLGTGIIGGYYPKILVKARYGDMPTRKIVFGREGISLGHDWNSWTIWSPLLRSQDLLVQVSTGDRFVLNDVSKSSWRGKVTQQKMKVESLQSGDIRYTVTDTTIAAAISSSTGVPFETPRIWG